MQETFSNKQSTDFDDEIDLFAIFQVLLEGRWIIITITAFLSVVGVIYSLALPNIYESKALLVPVNPSSGISGALRGYSDVAGLAGINLPPEIDEGNSKKAIKKISSLSFYEENILKNIFLPNLMAVKSWNIKTNKISYDDNIYDIKTNAWTRKYSFPMQQIPSAQEGFTVFKSNHLNLSEDKKTGFITISIKHQSPFVAKQWVELVVNEVNNFYRLKDKLQSEMAAGYLNQQILTTDFSEIKQVLAQLLQEEIKKLALIEANKFYVFDYIDPPAVMEEKSEPKRALICIIISLFGGVLSSLLVLIRHHFFKVKPE